VKVVNKSKHDLPKYATDFSAGMDIRANVENTVTIMPLQRKLISTGLYFELPVGFEMQVRPRSGFALKQGVTVLNTPGTLDCFSIDSAIKTVTGDLKINDLKINDVILSANDNMEIEKDDITAIIDKGLLEVYIIETDSGILEITPNTIVYTKDGLKLAHELTENDEILSF
jgi:dUTP pyrophosphatase